MQKPFTLAFPLNTLLWDGTYISPVAEDELQRQLQVFKAVGINHVMLGSYHVEEMATCDMDEMSLYMGDLLRQHGVTPTQQHGICPTFALPGTPQEKVQEHICRAIEFTANLGTDTLVFHAGRAFGRFDATHTVRSRYQEEVKRIGIDALLDICAENLRVAGNFAKSCGVRIALENVDRQDPMSNPKLLPQLINRVNLDNVGYCLDVGHAHCWGSSITGWIDLMKGKLFATHLHDNHGPQNTFHDDEEFTTSPLHIDEHLSPGLGTIDWREVITGLRQAGLTTVTFETEGWPIPDKEEGFRQAIAFWRLLEQQAG